MIAAKSLPMFEAEAKVRQREHGGTAPGKSLPPILGEVKSNCGAKARNRLKHEGEAVSNAAKVTGVSRNSVSAAAKVVKQAAKEVVQAVEQGEITVSDAASAGTVLRLCRQHPENRNPIHFPQEHTCLNCWPVVAMY